MVRSKFWSKHTVKPILRRRLYIGELVFGVTRSKGKRQGVRKGAKPIVTMVEHLRIVDQETWDKVDAQRAEHQVEYLRQSNGRLLSKPEATVVSKRMMNSIGRCYVCLGPLVYVSKSDKHRARYYCSNRQHRGAVACSNNAGILADELHLAVRDKLYDMLDKDFDKVVDLCMEQAAVWKERQAASVTDRQAQETEVARLESAVARLTDAIEQGQPVGDRLKQRRQELDTLRASLEEPALPDRSTIEGLIESIRLGLPRPEPKEPNPPYGPLVGLGYGDPATIRATLRKIGVTSILVAPSDDGGWTFKGEGDFSGLVLGNGHRRSKAARVVEHFNYGFGRARGRHHSSERVLDSPTVSLPCRCLKIIDNLRARPQHSPPHEPQSP